MIQKAERSRKGLEERGRENELQKKYGNDNQNQLANYIIKSK